MFSLPQVKIILKGQPPVTYIILEQYCKKKLFPITRCTRRKIIKNVPVQEEIYRSHTRQVLRSQPGVEVQTISRVKQSNGGVRGGGGNPAKCARWIFKQSPDLPVCSGIFWRFPYKESGCDAIVTRDAYMETWRQIRLNVTDDFLVEFVTSTSKTSQINLQMGWYHFIKNAHKSTHFIKEGDLTSLNVFVFTQNTKCHNKTGSFPHTPEWIKAEGCVI